MKRKIVVLGILSFFTICVPALFAQTLLHYWNFNTISSYNAHLAPSFTIGGARIDTLRFEGGESLIAFDQGTNADLNQNLNAKNGDPAGTHLRFNNPLYGALIFSVPSTGYQDIVIKYASVRSGSGAHFQHVFYTTDGVNYVLYDIFEVNTSVEQKVFEIDLKSVAAANNNPQLKVKITFGMGGGGFAGNNRFDNFSVESIPLEPERVRGVRLSVKDTLLEEGSSFQLQAMVFPESAVNKRVFWSSSVQDIATVDSNGNVRAIKTGLAKIRVKTEEGGFQDSCEIVVNSPTLLDLLYFWHFNDITSANDVTELLSDFSFASNSGKLTYTRPQIGERDMDRFTPGTVLNSQSNTDAGAAVRVRNPSVNRSILFEVPTTGMKDIFLSFAVQRSGNGMLQNIVEYSIDGLNFTSFGLQNPIKTVEGAENWQVFSYDFSTIPATNNNPHFKIIITWDGNTTSSSGNNRYDNIALMGTSYHAEVHSMKHENSMLIYPNPCMSAFNIRLPSPLEFKKAYIFNATGELEREAVQTSISMADMSTGVYVVYIETMCGQKYTQRLVKTSN
jgi:hypothetical protein